MKIGAVVRTVAAEIQCPRCPGRHMAIAGDKATCRTCGHVWKWGDPPKVMRTCGCLRCSQRKQREARG